MRGGIHFIHNIHKFIYINTAHTVGLISVFIITGGMKASLVFYVDLCFI